MPIRHMTKIQDSPLSFTAGEDIGAYLRVKLSARTAYLAGAGEFGVGVCQAAVSSGGFACIKSYEQGGTMKMVASGVINSGDLVYAAASGKITQTKNTKRIGTALEGATGNNSIIEVLPSIGYLQSSSSSSSSSSS